jgi:hypothetical protein
VLDESGVWVISTEPALHALLAERAWPELFWDHRTAVANTMDFIVVGHALLEKMRAPYPGITGKCLLLPSATPARDAVVDDLEAQAIAALDGIDSPRQLTPLPVQGIPGWDAANSCAVYYANADVFRPLRK